MGVDFWILIYVLGILACYVYIVFEVHEVLHKAGQPVPLEWVFITVAKAPTPVFLGSWAALIYLLIQKHYGNK